MMEYFYTSTYSTLLTDVAPAFSLPQHVSVFNLACELSIPALKTQALQKYCHTLKHFVSNLDVYFSSVRTIYSTPPITNSAGKHMDLRLAVVETAVLEMRSLLAEGSEQRKGFLELTTQVPEFQADIYKFLWSNGGPQRQVEVIEVVHELCEQCGRSDEGDGYEITLECKRCGEERTIEIL